MPRYDACLGRILSRAPGCPDEIAIDALRDACVEFSKRTYALTTGLQTASLQAAVLVEDGLDVVDVLSAKIDGSDVDVLPVNDPRIDMATLDEPVIVFVDINRLHIAPQPPAPVVVDLLLVVAPSADGHEFPDVLWRDYRETLIKGAVARVLMDEGTPWVKPQLSAVMRQGFESEMSTAAWLIGRNRQTVARRLRVKPA